MARYIIRNGNDKIRLVENLSKNKDGKTWSARGAATTYSFDVRRGVLADFPDRLCGGHVSIRKLTERDADTLQVLDAELTKLAEERAKFVREAAERAEWVKVG